MSRANRTLGGAAVVIFGCVVSAILACNDQHLTGPRGPGSPPIAALQGAPDVPVQGCAKWKVTLTGGTGVTVTSLSNPSCGPIVPILDSTPSYNSTTKSISLPIADSNSWTRQVAAPARAYAWNDSIVITTPSGLKNGTSGTYLQLTGMDSTIGSSAAQLKNARLWRYDTLLAPHGQTQILLPGGKSRRRTLQIQVVSGNPTVFTILVRVQAQNAFPVPATPPDSEPAWIAADSALIHSGPLGGNYFSRHVISLQFHQGTSQQLKQAAIDSVRGKVVGGDPDADIYLVDVPSDTLGTLIQNAVTKLLTLPQVWFADPDAPKIAAPMYTRPNDG